MKMVNKIAATTTPAPARLLSRYSLIGLTVVCLLATVEISHIGRHLRLDFYVIPMLVGGLGGFLIGLLQLRIYRLLAEAQQALSALNEQSQQTLSILEAIPDGLLVTDSNGRIKLTNEQTVHMLSIPREKLLGQPLEAVLPSKSSINTNEKKSVTISHPKNNHLEDRLKNITTATSTIKLPNAQNGGIIVLLHDNSAAQRIDSMKVEFISNATHNLKTPITAITGYSELLLDQQNFTTEQTAQFLRYINENAWKLDGLVNSLLDITRAESGRKINLSKQPYPAAKLFTALKGYCAAQLTTVKTSFNIADTNCLLNIDIRKIELVLEELMSNANKFAPAASTITISGSRQASRYTIAISDEGIGMTPEQCQQVFDKFYRVDGSDSSKKGFGLGLTLAKNIIEAHGGEICAASIPKHGTTLSFYLPIIDNDVHDN